VRRVLLLAALLAAAVAAAPASASQVAAPRSAPVPLIGVGDQNPRMFVNPYFGRLDIKYARVITAWDSLKHVEIVFALEDRFGVLSARQSPEQHQAAAPQAILPRIVSMTRAPASV